MMSKQWTPHWNIVPCCTCPPSPGNPCIPLQRSSSVGLLAESRAVMWLRPAISPRRWNPAHWWARSLENLWGICFVLCPLPAGCTRAAQSLVRVPHLENSVLKPQLEPLPFSWWLFSYLEKKLLYQLSGYLIPRHLTLFGLQSWVTCFSQWKCIWRQCTLLYPAQNVQPQSYPLLPLYSLLPLQFKLQPSYQLLWHMSRLAELKRGNHLSS